MISRIRKSIDKRDEGFTLIELLVVMIIIGILAAIAIPVFLSQRSKAVDSSAKADVSTIGKEIATYYVDNTAAVAVTLVSGRYLLGTADIGKASSAVSGVTVKAAPTSTTWCVDVTYAGGTVTNQKYSAAGGLASGAC